MTAWMVAAVAVDAGWVLGGILLWVLTQILTGVVAAKVTGAGHREQIKTLFANYAAAQAALKDLAAAQARQADQIIRLGEDRLKCRADSLDNFVNKSEHVRVIGQQTAFERQIVSQLDAIRNSMDAKLGDVHHRITEAVKQLARIEGQKGEL